MSVSNAHGFKILEALERRYQPGQGNVGMMEQELIEEIGLPSSTVRNEIDLLHAGKYVVAAARGPDQWIQIDTPGRELLRNRNLQSS